MNLPKFEPLKRFFTEKKSNAEVEMLKVQVRALQNALDMEEEHHQNAKNILHSIIELESVELPITVVLDIFDYLHMDVVEDFSK